MRSFGSTTNVAKWYDALPPVAMVAMPVGRSVAPSYLRKMARGAGADAPLVKVRRLLRDVRQASGAQPGALSGAVEIALYRLPRRQREILRRYDLEGEPARTVQRALGLSQRQFYRDRRAGLGALHASLFGDVAQSPADAQKTPQPASAITVRETQLAQRALARSLWQSGNTECLRVLSSLAQEVTRPALRAELLLDLADAAGDYDDEATLADATSAASRIVDEVAPFTASGRAAYLLGRIARARGRLEPSAEGAAGQFTQAVSLLRASLRDDPGSADARSLLADTLNDNAATLYYQGELAEARATSAEASALIEQFSLASRPKALETLAGKLVLDGFFCGRIGASIEAIAALLLRAIDSGWCSTAIMLGAYLIGLNASRGDYDEAIRWHGRISSSLLDDGRPADRTLVAIQAAHAYTMSGRAEHALPLLHRVRPGVVCSGWDVPYWHAEVGAALERLGKDAAALDQARTALLGFEAQGARRAQGSAHRIMALCYAKLGESRAAREHIAEAARLAERYGTPYQLLQTLSAKADIFGNATLKSEASEFARLLRSLN
jgi:tetratricopeptide (TPR) repeat protein